MWKHSLKEQGRLRAFLSVAKAYATQFLLLSVVYSLGFAFTNLFPTDRQVAALTYGDYFIIAVLLLAGLVTSVLIHGLGMSEDDEGF
jgi:hypothetical protein